MRALFLSSNGVGLGHLARQMAVADRLPADCRAHFATMSYAVRLAMERGYLTFFLAHHRANGLDVETWNARLEAELALHVEALRPDVLVYDATAVYSGLLEITWKYPQVRRIWLRRAMWREEHAKFLLNEDRFDLVIEPGELAEALDEGPTRGARAAVTRVPPVLHLDPAARLDRTAARAALGLPDEATVIGLQLANDGHLDGAAIQEALGRRMAADPALHVLEFRSPLLPPVTEGALGPRHRVVATFPAFRLGTACDLSVSAAGYNSFHENVLGAVPTLFVPNESPEMDLQLNRARWAEGNGMAATWRRDDPPALFSAALDRLLDPAERAAMAARCRAIEWTNGADEIAAIVAGEGGR